MRGILTRNHLGAEGRQLPERPGIHPHPFSPQPSTGAGPQAGTAVTQAPLCLWVPASALPSAAGRATRYQAEPGWSPSGQAPRPWDFPDQNTAAGCHFLLRGIFPTEGSNPDLPRCRQTLYSLSHRGALPLERSNLPSFGPVEFPRTRLLPAAWTLISWPSFHVSIARRSPRLPLSPSLAQQTLLGCPLHTRE